MADTSAQDRNLPASQRKLQKARDEGQVARSRDLAHFAAIAAGAGAVALAAPRVSGWLQQVLANSLHFDHATTADPAAMGERLLDLTGVFLWIALPLGVLMIAVAVVAAVGSGGWVWTLKPLAPKLDKLNPITGLPRMLSKQQLTNALKASLLALILITIGAIYLLRNIAGFGSTLTLPLPAALSHTGGLLLGGVGFVMLALAAFALVDVPLQRRMHATQLKMSHQEAKQEHKELEGNAEVKSKVRAMMRERASRRMLAAVPRADLVVMNPTHYAVALRYDEATMAAPRVVAKGADLLAMRIRDTAKEHKVPVLQSPVLARALYAHAEVDREIPAALFGAVAQVLAYVYQLRAALIGRAPMPAEVPDVDVPRELDPHAKKSGPAGTAGHDAAASDTDQDPLQ
jgi:flagellar biosynthetic protein FlhB